MLQDNQGAVKDTKILGLEFLTNFSDMEIMAKVLDMESRAKIMGILMMANTMNMDIMTITVTIMEDHTRVITMLELVADRANNVLTGHLQTSLHTITIAAEAVGTEDMPTTNKFFMTRW